LQFPTFQFLWFFENLIFVQYFIFLIFLVHSLKDNRDSHRILGDGKEKEHLGEHLSHQMELIDTKFDLSRGKNTCQPKLLPPSIKIL
jgi:hypothetical protein